MNPSDRFSLAAAPLLVAALLVTAALFVTAALPPRCAAQYNTAPPAQPVRTVFIHHSVGENWLREDHGGLAPALYANNYHIHDTNYDWGPVDEDAGDANVIGNHTDIGYWYNWFLAPHRDTYLQQLYANERLTDGIAWSDSCADPGGENTIILFKSCFVSATYISGSAGDPPLAAGLANPIRGIGMDVDAGAYTVANIKGLYRDLLTYFASRQDKLFVLITTPPSCPGEASPAMPLLRDINNWLVGSWLSGYAYNNVMVFDFSCVLTSNGGDTETNDLGAAGGSHHRFRNGAIEHVTGPSPMLAYGTWDQGSASWDNHPTPTGGLKATAEFLPLLNIAYNRWRGNTPALPAAPTLVSPPDSAADLTTAPTLVWSAVAGAQSYTAQLATNATFTAGIREQVSIGGTQYVAAGLTAGTGYFWHIRAVNAVGSGPWSAVRFFTTAPTVGIGKPPEPGGFRIAGVYPQPARGGATVLLESNRAQRVTLTLHDALGRLVAVPFDAAVSAGTTGAALRTATLASGLYLLRAAGDGAAAMQRVLVARE
jgi:hypothetical protein